MNNSFVTVIIPAFNEGDVIYKTVSTVKKVPLVNEVIVVDDGSTDNTSLEAKRAGAELIQLTSNKGKGYALNTGVKYAKEKIIAFLDGDIGESALELSKLVKPIINEKADITIGKFVDRNNSRGLGLVKKFAVLSVFIIGGKYITSPLSGQRVMTKEAVDLLFPLEKDFGIEIDETIKAIKNNLKIKEINVTMSHRKTHKDFIGFRHRFVQGYQIFKTVFLNHFIKQIKG